ncbi:MAG: hypothetical protein HYT77_01000 [Deltaproteobacteria bacterium]|nr:hypothetical protein [Deltaproteobacteria bacterium]
MTNFEELLKELVSSDIDFVVVGGLAAVTHGSAYETRDLDICYRRSKENIKKLVRLLKSLQAKLRGPKEEIPFILDEKTFSFGVNFTFTTRLGDFDLLGELGGVGSYEKVEAVSEPIDLCELKIKVLSLDGLIASKKAANRPKDQMHLKELEAIKELKRKI